MENNKIIIPIAMVIVVILLGTVGYSIIENWNLIDSFYMTIITLTTTGFGEVKPLSTEGRLFTTILIFVGVSIVAYVASTTMSTMFLDNFQYRRRKKMEKQISKLKGHTIICGYGRMGKVICEELMKSTKNIVVIEQDVKHIQELEESKIMWLGGNAAQDDILIKAGIANAKVLVSMIDNDADGLYLTLAARSFNPNIFLIIRANHEQAKTRIMRAGADKVVLPFVMSGKKVAQSVLNPNVEDLLDITGINDDDDKDRLQIVDINIKDGQDLIGKSLRNCGFKRQGLIIVGIKKIDGSFEFAPSADYHFNNGDCLIALGTKESYEEVITLLNHNN